MAKQQRTGRRNAITNTLTNGGAPPFTRNIAMKALDTLGASYQPVRTRGGPNLIVGWKSGDFLLGFKPMPKWTKAWRGGKVVHAADWHTLFKGLGVGPDMQSVVLKKLEGTSGTIRRRTNKPTTTARRGPGRPRLQPAAATEAAAG